LSLLFVLFLEGFYYALPFRHIVFVLIDQSPYKLTNCRQIKRLAPDRLHEIQTTPILHRWVVTINLTHYNCPLVSLRCLTKHFMLNASNFCSCLKSTKTPFSHFDIHQDYVNLAFFKQNFLENYYCFLTRTRFYNIDYWTCEFIDNLLAVFRARIS
jgi:hypothetical protein